MCPLFHCLMVKMGEGCLLSHHCHCWIEMKRVSAVGGVAERSWHCSFCWADYWGGGVGRYYEEWWAGVGGSLRCKVLHLVPHRAVKRWRPNRWQNSPSETSHRLSISTQFKTVWASVYPLISSTCSVRTEHEIWDKYYWYCSNELFITLDSRCLL